VVEVPPRRGHRRLPRPPARRRQRRVRAARRAGRLPARGAGGRGPAPVRRPHRPARHAARNGRVPDRRRLRRARGSGARRRRVNPLARRGPDVLARLAGVVAVQRHHGPDPAPARQRRPGRPRGARPGASPADRRGGAPRRHAARRRHGCVRAIVRPVARPPGAPLLGAAVLALGAALRPAGDERRPARRHGPLDLGRRRRARPVRGGIGDEEPARAAGFPAGRLRPAAAARRADRAAAPDRGGAGGQPAPVPVRHRGSDGDGLPLPPRGGDHLRQPRLPRGLRPRRRRSALERDGLDRILPGRSQRPRGARRAHARFADPRARGAGDDGRRRAAVATLARARAVRRSRCARRGPGGRPGHHRSQARRGRAAGARGPPVG